MEMETKEIEVRPMRELLHMFDLESRVFTVMADSSEDDRFALTFSGTKEDQAKMLYAFINALGDDIALPVVARIAEERLAETTDDPNRELREEILGDG